MRGCWKLFCSIKKGYQNKCWCIIIWTDFEEFWKRSGQKLSDICFYLFNPSFVLLTCYLLLQEIETYFTTFPSTEKVSLLCPTKNIALIPTALHYPYIPHLIHFIQIVFIYTRQNLNAILSFLSLKSFHSCTLNHFIVAFHCISLALS